MLKFHQHNTSARAYQCKVMAERNDAYNTDDARPNCVVIVSANDVTKQHWDTIRHIVAQVRHLEVQCFPEDIPPGVCRDTWAGKCFNDVTMYKFLYLVCIITPEFLKCRFCQFCVELSRTNAWRCHVIPVVVNGVALPYCISNLESVHVNHVNPRPELEVKLLKTLRQVPEALQQGKYE